MPASPSTTRLLSEAERGALCDALAAARRHEAEALQAEAVEHMKEAGWKGALTPLGIGGKAPQAADAVQQGSPAGQKGSDGKQLHSHMPAAVDAQTVMDDKAVATPAAYGAQNQRTLAEDWASLLLALRAPVVWGGACWRMFYLTCLNGFTFFTPLIIKSLLGASVSGRICGCLAAYACLITPLPLACHGRCPATPATWDIRCCRCCSSCLAALNHHPSNMHCLHAGHLRHQSGATFGGAVCLRRRGAPVQRSALPGALAAVLYGG